MITLKTLPDVTRMRQAGRVVAEMLERTRTAAKPGATTADLDRVAREVLAKHGAGSNFLNYGQPPYPATICTSINEQIVHGIPSADRRLRDGDIVSIDAGAIIEGWHADAAVTVPVGRVSEEARRLIAVTEEALRRAIAAARVGGRIGDIGAAVQTYAERNGYSVVRNYVGHGIGRAMHEEPQVPNYGIGDRGLPIKQGLCLAIEPMLNAGAPDTMVQPDKWTVVTADGSLSAHFEHTIWCTDEGAVVLTSAGDEADARLAALAERRSLAQV